MGRAPELCVLCPHNEPGERQSTLATPEVGAMVSDAETPKSTSGNSSESFQDIGQGREQRGQLLHGVAKGVSRGEDISKQDPDDAGPGRTRADATSS